MPDKGTKVVMQFGVILSKLLLRREGCERAARGVAMFATRESHVWLASLPNYNHRSRSPTSSG
jgi:hypothetical protein